MVKDSAVKDYYVDPYPGRKGSERITENCGSCGGDGIYHAPSGLTFYTATVGAVHKGCFACHGTGKTSRLVSSARATVRRAASIRAECEARAEMWAAERENFKAKYAAELAMAAEMADKVPAAREALETYEGLGACDEAEYKLKGLAGAVARWQAREDAKRPVPVTDKRMEVVGEVVSTRWQDGYMPGSGCMKMLVKCDGYKLWGSVPAAEGGMGVGDMVSFMARVEASADDKAFGFFSRPTKAKVTERAK